MPESLLRVEPGTCISVPYEDKPDGVACVLAVLQKVSMFVSTASALARN